MCRASWLPVGRNPRSFRSIGGFLLLFLLLLSACGQIPTAGLVVTSGPAANPLSVQTRPEGAASTPCGPLWAEGEPITLRGLYRTTGDEAYLDVVRSSPDAAPCWARFFLDKDLGLGPVDWENPPYVQVTGRPSSGRWDSLGLWDVQVLEWAVLSLDQAAVRAACRQVVAAHTPALQALDWSALALPAFVTGTAGFRPTAADLANVKVQLDGADDHLPQLLLTARGPDLPAVRPLVTRWVLLECVYDMETAQIVELVATIRGEVQE